MKMRRPGRQAGGLSGVEIAQAWPLLALLWPGWPRPRGVERSAWHGLRSAPEVQLRLGVAKDAVWR